MFPDIPSFSYILTTASFVSPSYNTSMAIVNTALFKGVEEAAVKSLLSIEAVIISEVNLASISKMIINSEFIVIISF